MNGFALQPRQRGLSMLEVLVGTLLISFALLGLVALQSRTVQLSSEAEDSQRASLLAMELSATMWASNNINLPVDVIADWQTKVSDPATSGLPNGDGQVVIDGNIARITVEWSPPWAKSVTSKYTTQVLIPVEPK